MTTKPPPPTQNNRDNPQRSNQKYKPVISFKKWHFSKELEVLEEWKNNGTYKAYKMNPNSKKPIFSIDTPPPYPSGRWHVGAVAHYTMIDMIARTQRLRGYNVHFPWGLDRNGINIELVVEKKEGKSLYDFDRAEFITKCQKEITKISNDLDTIAKRIGLSVDFDNPYKTDSDRYRAVTQRTFIELYEKGYIYEDLRPNNYCPGCKTTIADAEIYYKDGEITLNYIKFPIEGQEDLNNAEGHILIATTRPELICACQTVLVHPEDDRYKKFHGKKALLPIFGRSVPIQPHPSAKMEYGSGVVMICSFGDSTDVQLFRELNLEPIKALDLNVKFTSVAGKYEGMSVHEAREAILEDLDKFGFLESQEQAPHKYPTCERSKDRVEIILLKEYYIKQVEFLDDLKKFASKMRFHPKKNRNILLDWINSITIDWPISRRRYYHTEIPVWKCNACGEIHVPEPGKYYQPWREPPPFENKPCKKCGSTSGYTGETKTFDTWMDSSNSSIYILKYGQDPEFFKTHYPCSIRPQGRDIVRTWLYYTILKNRLLFDHKPFHHVWISGLGMDKYGRKMSKSLGNVINPDDVIKNYGVDAFRYSAAAISHVGEDFRIDEEKIDNNRKTLTKFFNIAKFTSMFPDKSRYIRSVRLRPVDMWILSELNLCIKKAAKGYADFDFIVPLQIVRNFFVNNFANHYLEMTKVRAYEGDKAVWATLHVCLKAVLKLFHPIIPFLTYKLYQEIYGKNIQLTRFSKPILSDLTESYQKYTNPLTEFNATIWKHKTDQNLSKKEEIHVIVPEELKPFREELIEMHHLV
ncbi:MAG: valine--tRNA ligase [Candidatus Lokiarchaeota archaeon]|nr:valine--tRNA ligase [Candidatus Lokiarchaeota archaeon]